MQRLIEQLETVRWRARVMLIVMRVAMWLSAVLGAALALGVLDFIFRLPGWLRLAVGLAVAGGLIVWAINRIGWTLRVDLALTTIAQRLERLHPDAAGRLASAVAFSTQANRSAHAVGVDRTTSQQFAEQARRNAEGVLDDTQVAALLDARRMWQQLAILAVMVLLTGGIAIASPDAAGTAVQRWVNPLGDAAWPNRFAVQSLTEQRVAPNHVPVRLAAEVTKGDRAGLRTWVGYQFLDDASATPSAGAWQRALMTRQDADAEADADVGGRFERLVEAPPSAGAIAFFFEAGDGQTQVEVLTLVRPPELTEVVAQVEPPAYAADFVTPQHEYLLTPPRPSVTMEALRGSRAVVEARVEGSFDAPASNALRADIEQWVTATFPGLVQEPGDIADLDLTYELVSQGDDDARVRVGWTMMDTRDFQFHLADAYGTRYEDQRLFRFEARRDREPSASVVDPGSDQQVLPSAVVQLRAEGQDDVAVDWMDLRAFIGDAGGADPQPLARAEPREPRANLSHEIDLSEWGLEPGTQVGVVAVVQDNFNLNGETHEPVESSVRWLRIITEEEMRRQLQMDLSDVRERAIRARRQQQELREAEADRATASQQQDMSERLGSMQRTIEGLQDRLERNRLESEAIEQTLDRSEAMVDAAREQAEQAADDLARAAGGDPDDPQTQQDEDQARQAQAQVSEQLDQLVQLLDQGRDAFEIQEQLTRLQREQDVLADTVSELMPRTLGQDLEDLVAEDREALSEAGEGQRDLSEDAAELVERMRSTAAALARNAERPEEQAIAEALAEAAATADQEALEERMEQAADDVDDNRLSQAQQEQQEARETLRQMMEQMGRVEQLRQEILSRQLLELVEAIRELRDTQQAEIERLEAAGELAGFDDGPLMRLRQNTLAVADDARRAGQETVEVSALLEEGANYMRQAVTALRQGEPRRDAAEQAERNALARLEEALELARELAAGAQQQMSEQERQELIEAYQQAIDAQQQLIDRTREMDETPEDDRTRRWRADVRNLGDGQTAIREDLAELGEKVEGTIVYRSMHDELDEWTSSAARSLRDGNPGVNTVFRQDMVVGTLEALIEALEDANQPVDPFQDGGGGGGDGNGEMGEPELIPDLAELRLLRSRQLSVHQLTRLYDERGDIDADLVGELSRQQRSLARTGEQLIQQLQQQQQGPGGGAAPPDGEPRSLEDALEGLDDADDADQPQQDAPPLEPELEQQLQQQRQQESPDRAQRRQRTQARPHDD